ncbi:MAG TPA: hypothetical protein VD996_15290 [Chitinophagaceae bacterium]|nr:hypothetical protein [Chitinophagaceae bacterium]
MAKKKLTDFEKMHERFVREMTISDNMPNLSKDPTIIKRAQEARDFLEKHGYPNFNKKPK